MIWLQVSRWLLSLVAFSSFSGTLSLWFLPLSLSHHRRPFPRLPFLFFFLSPAASFLFVRWLCCLPGFAERLDAARATAAEAINSASAHFKGQKPVLEQRRDEAIGTLDKEFTAVEDHWDRLIQGAEQTNDRSQKDAHQAQLKVSAQKLVVENAQTLLKEAIDKVVVMEQKKREVCIAPACSVLVFSLLCFTCFAFSSSFLFSGFWEHSFGFSGIEQSWTREDDCWRTL